LADYPEIIIDYANFRLDPNQASNYPRPILS
jgi:hypothetical protein